MATPLHPCVSNHRLTEPERLGQDVNECSHCSFRRWKPRLQSLDLSTANPVVSVRAGSKRWFFWPPFQHFFNYPTLPATILNQTLKSHTRAHIHYTYKSHTLLQSGHFKSQTTLFVIFQYHKKKYSCHLGMIMTK